jgi:hypothetical protein
LIAAADSVVAMIGGVAITAGYVLGIEAAMTGGAEG